MTHYKANWSPALVLLSSLLTLLCLGLAVVVFLKGAWWVSLLLLALVAGCALFSIRGYTVTPQAILVHRLFWATRVPLSGLQSARPATAPMWMAFRIGNGGFFSFSGWRYSPAFGFYRVFLTNHRDAVVLQYPRRKIVVSPATPEAFAAEVSAAAGAV